MNWEDVERKVLSRIFPPLRYIGVKSTITNFSRGIDEPLYEAWERYKSLLRMSKSWFDDLAKLNMFCSGPRPQTKLLLDASTGGTMMTKDEVEATVIIKSLSTSDH